MRASALLLLAGLASPAIAAEPFRQLKTGEIRARFAGMEFTDEVHWATVFARDGTFASYEMGAVGKGRWSVDKDELCLTDASAKGQPRR